ncbi:hypothetical protein I7I48_09872 [Histoplasma ohiense]|nr:hypothetical protein I7I48_09872 [Histoplasma ohiense (nom. inval.)]
MSEDPSNSTSSASATPSAPSARPRGRRASIASGTSFSELFTRPGSSAAPPQPPPTVSINIPGSIMTSANAQAQQRRRTSISTLGLSGSPTQQSSPFGSAPGMRRGSISSSAMSGSPTWEDSVLEENGNDTPMSSPTAPFTRRVSFGAQAFRDRVGSANANGEGFNWPEALRTRAERAPSFGSFPPSSPTAGFHGSPPNHSSAPHFKHHQRAASIATMEQPVREMHDTQQQPKPKQKPKPDYFQEKILRGDFMD